MNNLKEKSLLILKVDIPAIMAVALFAGLIFIYLLPGFEDVMMERKRNLIREMTSSAYSLLSYYHSLETGGSLDPDTARIQAMSAIGTLRYGDALKDYFWITDMHPRMIIHPYRHDLNGQDLSSFRDSKGKLIFVEFVEAAKNSGESYVEYMWQWNDDSTRIVPKLSFVKLFEPWGWIIGTGIYIEDVRTEIRRLEMRALIISSTIGLIIVVLLSATSRQTHRIENKRKKAEDDLHRSRELYRTLAEAALEGVLIWSEYGLQANKTLISWLGYTESELKDLHLQQVFITEWDETPVSSSSLYAALASRRYLEGDLKTKTGNLLRTLADFSRIQLNDLNAVLAVLRPLKQDLKGQRIQLGEELLDNIPTGFFRITPGRKNRFIFATKPALSILGYNTLRELSSTSIDDFFVDHLQLEYFKKVAGSKENIKGMEILIRRKGGDELRVMVSLSFVETGNDGVWYEGSIELLSASDINLGAPGPELSRYGASYILEAPASLLMRPVLKLPEKMQVSEAVSLLKENNAESAVIINPEGEAIGTIDTSALAGSLNVYGFSESEINRWMFSPPVFIGSDAKIYEAFSLMHSINVKTLLVQGEEKQIAGIITHTDVAEACFTVPGMIEKEIKEASSPADLRSLFGRIRRMAVFMVLGHAVPSSVSLYISKTDDLIYRKSVELCLEKAGKPPCRFAFILTGSAGRGEPTLSTDQDNAIIFEDLPEEENSLAQAYFLALGKSINDDLSTIGYQKCKGGNMAGNPRWCKPLSVWKKYFSEWIKNPGPEELLEVSICFDFRFCYGHEDITEELRDFVLNNLPSGDIYFHHMANAWKEFSNSIVTREGKNDLKRILMIVTGIVRLYALKHRITDNSTTGRIAGLLSGGYIDASILRDALSAWNNLSAIRLNQQAVSLAAGREPDNTIITGELSPSVRYLTNQAVENIKDLVLKAGTDFFVQVI